MDPKQLKISQAHCDPINCLFSNYYKEDLWKTS